MRDTFERSDAAVKPGLEGRPWLGVRFICPRSGRAAAYTRVYRNQRGTAYVARCPVCGTTVRFRVASGGTACRFFEVRCGE